MKSTLSQSQRKFLKGVAHDRKPVVSVGNKGLTDSVLEETRSALAHHELIKIKLPAGEKSMRIDALEKICASCGAEFVTLIGRTGVVFKAAKDSKIELPA